uniref:Uncharacterized protein n=1 Tax=Aegilops tauschii subsp. strangulata TaxID=200361 RepID=A0A452YXJ5_AEGTS
HLKRIKNKRGYGFHLPHAKITLHVGDIPLGRVTFVASAFPPTVPPQVRYIYLRSRMRSTTTATTPLPTTIIKRLKRGSG